MILTESQFGEDGDRMDINTPAIAAGYVVKRHLAQESDELSFEVGDIISIIEIYSPEETVWWRGKRGFQVGFFPSDCVEIIGDPSSLVFAHKALYPSLNSLNSTKGASPHKPVLRDGGKILTFFRSIIPNRPSSRSKYGHTGSHRDKVFGCDLSRHLYMTCRDIPLILKRCSEFIENHGIVDGIYRLSGVKSNIQRLKHAFDQGREPDLEDDCFIQDIHGVASLLKMYFRELPNPLLTYQLYEKFIKAVQPNLGRDQVMDENIPEPVKLANLRDVIRQLPPPHYRTLEYLLRHLAKVSSYGSETGMTPKNIAIVWAPNILRSQDLEIQGSVGALHFIGVQAVLTEYLIRYVDILFSKDYTPISKSRGRLASSSSLRPKSLPVSSTNRLITLEEARGRSGLFTESSSSKHLSSEGEESTGLNSKYHTVIELGRRGVGGDLKKIGFHINYLQSPS